MSLFHVKLYASTFLAFLAIDAVWIGLVARTFYKQHLGTMLAEEPRLGAAAAFYLVYIAALLVFVVLPALAESSLAKAVLLGAFFGLVCYATYDLTNLATLKGWPMIVTVVDLAWGTFLSAAVSGAGYAAGKWLSP